MKRLLASTAIVLAAATAASAQQDSGDMDRSQLVQSIQGELENYTDMQIQYDALSTNQLAQLFTTVNSGMNDSQKREQIEEVISTANGG